MQLYASKKTVPFTSKLSAREVEAIQNTNAERGLKGEIV